MTQQAHDQSVLFADIHRLIRAIENKFDVNSLTYRDVCVWPVVRSTIRIFMDGRIGKVFSPNVPLVTSSLKAGQVQVGFQELMAKSGDAERIRRADVLLMGWKSPRVVAERGKLVDVHFDPIVEASEGQFSCSKVLFSSKAELSERQELQYPYQHINLKPYLRAIVAAEAGANLNDSNNQIAGWEQLRKYLKASHSLELPAEPRGLIWQLNCILYLSSLMERVLANVHPKLVIFVGQNVGTFAMSLACYRAGIACADLQHGSGAANAANIKWFGLRHVPDRGYELLPDYFFVWENQSRDRMLSEVNRPVHMPLLFGNLALSRKSDLSEKQIGGADKRKTILVTLSWLSVDKPPEHLFEAIEKSPADWRWLVRMHPMDATDDAKVSELEHLFATRTSRQVEIREPSLSPLPELLRDVDRHVSMFSSTYVDASYFGIGTTFIHHKASSLFADLAGWDGYSAAFDAETLLATLAQPASKCRALVVSDRATAIGAIKFAEGRPRRGARSTVSRFPFLARLRDLLQRAALACRKGGR